MKQFNESFAKFFENPTRVGLKEILQYNGGEFNFLDFKKEWPEFSKLARHILALGNSGGGCIVVGVEELEDKTLSHCGIEKIVDKAQINTQVQIFIPSSLKFEIVDFVYNESEYGQIKGKKFQVLFVEYDSTLIPFVSIKDGSGIKGNTIYVRNGTSSQPANYQQLHDLLNTRIGTDYNSSTELKIEEHLRQLKMLYGQLNKHKVYYINQNNNLSQIGQVVASFNKAILGEKKEVINPNYPKEDYEEFISNLIEKKKRRVEGLFEV